ncbi:hypothetical protein PANDA_005362 [Ailuropoda melanoleuca]|uniref:Orange domain-containing protein n=1 Tax=Ailuropoda melanoleuca TaxID=9646 RepID=D2H601_AILME|nr:hypothetical protein PANDA_005362 [Ailuropoda melanoleuca]
MVRSARELGAGLAGDARALWPNTARSESKLPAHWGRRECACVCIIEQNPKNRNRGNGQRLNMDEGIPHLQERQLLEHRDFIGLDYSSLYMCKPKRSMKRDDSKVSTLGHLEKAVVLELTLKHLKALTALTEQQHQKIIALQNGERSLKSPIQSDLDAFHSGFQTCAKEVLQYLSRFESWTPREQRCVQLINHLHAVATQFLPTPQLLTQQKASAAAATLLPHEVAPPGALHPPHPRGRTHLSFAGAREPGNPESSAQEDPSQPGKETH